MKLSYTAIQRLGIAALLALTLTVVVSTVGITSLVSRQRQAELALYEAKWDRFSSISQLFAEASVHFGWESWNTEEEDPTTRLAIENLDSIRILTAELQELELSASESKVLQDLIQLENRFRTAVYAYEATYFADPSRDDAKETIEEIYRVVKESVIRARQLKDQAADAIRHSRAKVTLALNRSVLLMIISGGLVFAAGAWISILLTRSLTKPVRAILRATEELASGNLTYRLNSTQRDVLGRLSRGVDRMAEQIEMSTRALRAAHDDLEAKVQKRTVDLAEANRSLQAEIAERTRTEEKLRLTQFAVDHASDAVLWLGADARFTYVNDAATRLLGYSRDELLTMSVHDVNSQHSPEAWPEHWREIEEHGSFTFECDLRRKDGEMVTVEITVNLVAFEGKKINCAFVRDITERRAAEIEVRELKRQLEFILGATRTGLDIIDSEFNIRYIDPAWKEVYGDTTGRKCYEYFMGRDEVCPGCGVVEALKTRRIAVTEEVLVKENNRPVQVTTIPFQNEKGEWLVAEVNADISERKRAEESLVRLRTAVEQAMDGIAVSDLDGTIQFVNAAWAHAHCFEVSELQGKHLSTFHTDEQMKRDVIPLIEVVKEKGASEGEVGHVRRDGSEFPTWMSVSLLSDESGKPVGLVASAHDITERKQVEEALRQSEQRLRTLLDANPTGIAVIDAETHEIVDVNSAALEMIGASREDVVGRACHEYICPAEVGQCPITDLQQTVDRAERMLLRANGEKVPVLKTAVLIMLNGRECILESFVNITERKQAEDALQEERNKLRALVDIMDTMNVGLTIQDRDYNVVYQNDFLKKLTGGQGGKCYQVYESRDTRCEGCPAEKVFEDGQPHASERTIDIPEKGITYWDNTAHAIRNASGEITSCFEVVTNVTERKRAMDRQQKLSDLQRALLGPGEFGEKLKRITDGVVDVFGADFCRIWITRPGDRCESGCMHAKVTEGPHVCRHRDRCLWLMASSGRYTHIDGEVHRRVPFGCYKIGRVAAGEDSKFLTNEAATDPRVHNHEWVKELGLVSFAGYQLRPPGGETIGVLALFAKHAISPDEDTLLESLGSTVAQVVQKAKAEAENEALNKRLLDISRQAGMAEVATGVLHNVGNVLNSVNVSASIVAEKMRQSKAQGLTRAVTLLSEHADDLATFVTVDERGKHLPRFLAALAETLTGEQAVVLEELQSLTKNIEHIKTIVSTQQSYAGAFGVVESVSLNELLEDALRLSAPSFQRHSIQVKRVFAELPPIEVEKQKLLQVLINLVRNAKHALIERGGDGKQLTLRTAAVGDDRVRIEVMDNGVGIPAENMTRIFAHGFTTKQAKGGRGFGLHHSALAAKEMGGSLTAHSDGPGKGATFTLELPMQLAEVTQ
ncbi:MAG: PAS domain S-box protein [Phycisphaerae bacterium]|nr:PAS domain S-box protein [Phycisphaerae bacterium]